MNEHAGSVLGERQHQAGMLLMLAGLPWRRGEVAFMVAGAMVTVLLSWLVVRMLDPAIEGLRSRIRPRGPRSR